MKRQVALLLCGMLVISALAGCGGGQDDAGSGSQASVESNQESSTQESEENSEEEEASSDEAGGQSAYEETIPFTYTSNFSVNMMGSELTIPRILSTSISLTDSTLSRKCGHARAVRPARRFRHGLIRVQCRMLCGILTLG